VTTSKGARARIRQLFEQNVGKVLHTNRIAKVANIRDYQRRIRELRVMDGLQIKSHRDRADLKPGQYILETLERLPIVSSSISPALRFEILTRNGYTCHFCGRGPHDPEELNPGRMTRLNIDHVLPLSQGGTNDKSNLRVACAACNEARSNVDAPNETVKNILVRIHRLSRQDQRKIFMRLKETYGSDK
jgi:hypothetical protein